MCWCDHLKKNIPVCINIEVITKVLDYINVNGVRLSCLYTMKELVVCIHLTPHHYRFLPSFHNTTKTVYSLQ